MRSLIPRKTGSGGELESWMRLCDRFPHFPDLPVQVFRSYLVDFHCGRLVTEWEVRDALK